MPREGTAAVRRNPLFELRGHATSAALPSDARTQAIEEGAGAGDAGDHFLALEAPQRILRERDGIRRPAADAENLGKVHEGLRLGVDPISLKREPDRLAAKRFCLGLRSPP